RVAASTGHTEGLVIATGFFRHGVLLTPVAAKIVGGLLDGFSDPRWSISRPDRFDPRRSGLTHSENPQTLNLGSA
ncbi:hypothetical protein, partial [Paraburkholderia sp. SIMBA_030]|uniref:hypothetical protein n=1 Tax=Paraburkholderia sp. SIMBA_030 TaxID=3085773 RepID=UPI0039798DEA